MIKAHSGRHQDGGRGYGRRRQAGERWCRL